MTEVTATTGRQAESGCPGPQNFQTTLLRALSKAAKSTCLRRHACSQAYRAREYPLGHRIFYHAEAKLPEQSDSFRVVLDYFEHLARRPIARATGSHGRIAGPWRARDRGRHRMRPVTSTHALMPISGNAHLWLSVRIWNTTRIEFPMLTIARDPEGNRTSSSIFNNRRRIVAACAVANSVALADPTGASRTPARRPSPRSTAAVGWPAWSRC